MNHDPVGRAGRRMGTVAISRKSAAALWRAAPAAGGTAPGLNLKRLVVRLLSFRLPLLIIPVFTLAACDVRPEIPKQERLVYVHDSLYNHIVVSEDDEARYLRFGYGAKQSAMTLGNPIALRVPYTAYLALGMAFTNPERALMIGLAGGSVARLVRSVRPEVALDVVELDPDVVRVAERYFGVDADGSLRIHVDDGRMFVKRTTDRYDWVVLDAFHADSMPHHMATAEFFDEVKRILTPRGVVTMNVAPLGPGVLYLSIIRTLVRVFPQVYLFQVPERSNIVAVATLDGARLNGDQIVRSIRELKTRTGDTLELLIPATPYGERKPVVRGVPELTDDYAPVDWLRYWRGSAAGIR
ncbi:MAG: fused MFS/spermidine synthase [Candidatus Latescibacteria bacterium]|nr:fused MFS/spermidine synthase [Candidatus Latescibacterota bacterium]